jgi:hypothetical protein
MVINDCIPYHNAKGVHIMNGLRIDESHSVIPLYHAMLMMYHDMSASLMAESCSLIESSFMEADGGMQ